jgi:hypothetical protein
MSFWRRISPIRASTDLYRYLRTRRRHEVVFLVLSFSLTWAIMLAMIQESRIEHPYKRDIQYFQNWRADRTDAEIIAQQKIDGPKEAAAQAAQEKREADQRAAFKRMDDQMNAIGL